VVRITVEFLQVRAGRLLFRRRVPDHLRETIGQTEWRKSLGLRVGQELAAAAMVREWARKTDKVIKAAERTQSSGVGEAELAAATKEWARAEGFLKGGSGREAINEHGETFAALWVERTVEAALKRSGNPGRGHPEDEDFTPEELMRLRTAIKGEVPAVPTTVRIAAESYARRHRGGEMEKAEAVAVEQFVAFAGDLELAEIGRARVQDWFLYLRDTRGVQASTIRRRRGSMRTIVERAIEDFDLTIKNPFTGAKPPAGGKASSEDCLPFHTVHLALLDDYLARARIRADLRALFGLLRYTGCRLSELAGLDWSDVVLDHEVPHIRVRPNMHRNLKTKASHRDVPLVPAAVDVLALWSEDAKREGAVFPGAVTNTLSQRLNTAIRAAGIPRSRRLVAYSFRHGIKQALREVEAPLDIQERLLGHGKRTVGENYGASKPVLRRTLAALEKALPLLGHVERSNYRDEEWPQQAEGVRGERR
jgi:integrase